MAIWFPHKNISKKGVIPYAGNCPPYYDLKGVPWFESLNKQLPEIRKRVFDLLFEKKIDIPQYHENLLHKGIWESQAFLVCNVRRKLSKGKGKEVFELFENIPGVISIFISVLKPNTHVKAHNGDTDGSYRLHIPILIPTGLPECGIKVDGIARRWPENEILVFCDAHLHEVWNHSDKMRVVLIVDVVKPEYMSQTRKICTEVLAWLFLQKVDDALRPLPAILRVFIAFALMIVARPFFPLLQRRPR